VSGPGFDNEVFQGAQPENAYSRWGAAELGITLMPKIAVNLGTRFNRRDVVIRPLARTKKKGRPDRSGRGGDSWQRRRFRMLGILFAGV